MKIFKSKIDRLESEQKRLERHIDEHKSKTAFKNAKLEAKITKLEEQAFLNREEFAKFEEHIKLQLDRNAKLICAEADYAKQLGAKYRPQSSKRNRKHK